MDIVAKRSSGQTSKFSRWARTFADSLDCKSKGSNLKSGVQLTQAMDILLSKSDFSFVTDGKLMISEMNPHSVMMIYPAQK